MVDTSMNPFRVFTIYKRAHRVAALLEEASMSKSLFTSKLFWFNLLTGAAALVDVIPLPPEYTALAVALVNIGLRVVTKTPVHVVPQ